MRNEKENTELLYFVLISHFSSVVIHETTCNFGHFSRKVISDKIDMIDLNELAATYTN